MNSVSPSGSSARYGWLPPTTVKGCSNDAKGGGDHGHGHGHGRARGRCSAPNLSACLWHQRQHVDNAVCGHTSGVELAKRNATENVATSTVRGMSCLVTGAFSWVCFLSAIMASQSCMLASSPNPDGAEIWLLQT